MLKSFMPKGIYNRHQSEFRASEELVKKQTKKQKYKKIKRKDKNTNGKQQKM